MTDKFYVKPDVRVRWYQLNDTGLPNHPVSGGKNSTTDWQLMVGLGWKF